MPRLSTSDCDTALAAAKKAPGVCLMSGIMCSQGGHRIAGQMAKAFSSAQTPRHLCLPGILASLLKTVQSRKALLPLYLSEGGMASSTRAAQFMKALTRIVWRVVGRRTSLRLCSAQRRIPEFPQHWCCSRQLSHACAPIVTKCIGRASAVIPVELRQPGVDSLILTCSTDSRGDGSSLKVTSARLIHP